MLGWSHPPPDFEKIFFYNCSHMLLYVQTSFIGGGGGGGSPPLNRSNYINYNICIFGYQEMLKSGHFYYLQITKSGPFLIA